MSRQGIYIKRQQVKNFIRKANRNLRITPGFMAFLEIHIESVLKRALIHRQGQIYLDAGCATVACRYPFHVGGSKIGQES